LPLDVPKPEVPLLVFVVEPPEVVFPLPQVAALGDPLLVFPVDPP
jgi:hypothetical protein